MVKVKLNELSEGMIVTEPIYDKKSGQLLLKSDTKLTDKIIASLKTHDIMDVSIAERYTLSITPADITRKELKQILSNEIRRLVPEKAEANLNDKITEVAKTAIKIANEMVEETDIINLCVQMKISDNDYIYNHCVSTCALSLLVAGAMDLEYDEVKMVGKAALLHDIGLCEMTQILRKENKNAQEEALWKEHPQYGYYSALENGIDKDIAKLILYHHENWNGSGFPEKVAGDKIPLGSRIISVCETYDRLLRYEKIPHYLAVEYLYGGVNDSFDGNVINACTDNLPVYPLGSMVRLSTGEVGVVVNVRKNLGVRPIVRVYFNDVNRYYKTPKDKDLGEEGTIFIKEIL